MVTDSVGTRGPISSNSSLPFSYLCLNPSSECSSSIFRRDPFFARLRCAPKEIAASTQGNYANRRREKKRKRIYRESERHRCCKGIQVVNTTEFTFITLIYGVEIYAYLLFILCSGIFCGGFL